MKRPMVAVVMILLALSAGCRKEVEKKNPPAGVPPWENIYRDATPEAQVKNVIMRYDQLLVYGYENLDMNPLQEVTTVRLAEKAYHHMAAIGEGGARMRSRLTKIDFNEIKFPTPDKCEVKTREIWDFAYHDINTDAKKEERKDFGYLMDYRLERQNGRWMITDILAHDEKPEPVEKGAHGHGTNPSSGSGAPAGK